MSAALCAGSVPVFYRFLGGCVSDAKGPQFTLQKTMATPRMLGLRVEIHGFLKLPYSYL